ncbi:hypothetical protein C8N32_10544 [Rhodovulum imhoffii]|uniref:Uncharacterized protein n=1 Tax=Rhodovulum imhoffii TaxID=365340 RepID=A0A2T5BTE2_9RHOB|nr:hypothetical protein [Rhodovulum imhoffii]MBK5933004.1 hypothetical protein [Rhodovulum imhoffii]PTN02674.1 hypothetical protein C8N32_10544 [Rhodovulum imhoffii]
MPIEEMCARIVAFARHCGHDGMAPHNAAQSRGWLDDVGHPTKDGRALLDALREQDNTRGIFRAVI